MFDISWSELLILGIVTLVFVGPKELPVFLRTIGKYVGMVKRQAGEFREQFDTAMREAEFEQIRKDMMGVKTDVESTMRGLVQLGFHAVEFVFDRAAGVAHRAFDVGLDAHHVLADLLELGLTHRSVELLAELARLPLHHADVFADGAQEDRQLLRTHEHQGHDAENEKLAPADVEHRCSRLPVAMAKVRPEVRGQSCRGSSCARKGGMASRATCQDAPRPPRLSFWR